MEETTRHMEETTQELSRLNKRTGILVEEKARTVSTDLFGSDFSKRLLIKSLYEVLKLISKADDALLPKEHGTDAQNKAAKVLIKFLEPLRFSFFKSAGCSISDAASHATFNLPEFEAPKATINDITTQIQSSAEEETLANIAKNCGMLLGAVAKLGTKDFVGEQETEKQRDKRVKMMTGRFKRKLERLKNGFTCRAKEDISDALATCSGPGIMFCCALAYAPKKDWRNEDALCKWISDTCDIFDYNEEVECDLRGSVSLVEKHATISCGEIKSNASAYGEAVKQMELRSKLVEFVLQCIFDHRFEKITKKGHLFVLEMIDEDQRRAAALDDGGELSIFVHHTK